MDIYVQGDTLKGFPVLNETSRGTATSWSKGYRGDKESFILQHENEFINAKITGIDWRDCNGGNAWKMEIPIGGKNIIFDLREDKLLEILQESSVVNGIIQCPLTVIDGNRFAMVGGKFHQEYLAKEAKKALPKISNKDLVIGTVYKTAGQYAERKVFLGRHKINGKSSLCFALPSDRWSYCKEPLHLDDVQFMTSTNFKVIDGKYDNIPEMLEESIRQHEKFKQGDMDRYQQRLDEYNKNDSVWGRSYWKPEPPNHTYNDKQIGYYKAILEGLKNGN